MIYKNEDITNVNINKKNRILAKIILLVFFTIAVILIYSAFLISYSLDVEEQEYIFGMKAFIVETNSMEPELKIGDVIIVKKVDVNKLHVGDIITFKNRGEIITHRITEIDYETERFKTKGDKNTLNDIESVKYSDIEGIKILKLSNFEKISYNFRHVMYLILILLIIVTAFLHNRRVNRKRMLRRRKKKNEDKKSENNSKKNY